jgi:hypothetical protein
MIGAMPDNHPLIVRFLNPGVPWWVAIPCNVLACVALVLLIQNPANNLPLWLLGTAVVALYGTTLVMRVRKR